MNTSVRRLLVVGGNGFIGTNCVLSYDSLCISSTCRFCGLQGRAQARNPGDECEVVTFSALKMHRYRTHVSYPSSSGLPFRTTKGHSPAWTSNVPPSSQTMPFHFALIIMTGRLAKRRRASPSDLYPSLPRS